MENKTLSDKVWNDGEEGCHNMYYESDLKESIDELKIFMPKLFHNKINDIFGDALVSGDEDGR